MGTPTASSLNQWQQNTSPESGLSWEENNILIAKDHFPPIAHPVHFQTRWCHKSRDLEGRFPFHQYSCGLELCKLHIVEQSLEKQQHKSSRCCVFICVAVPLYLLLYRERMTGNKQIVLDVNA